MKEAHYLKIFWNWFCKHFVISIQEIAFCGLFIALWIVSYKYISLNLRFMRVGIVYAWVILIGLIFRPQVGFIIAIIADNLALLLGKGFAFWMIEYAAIYPTMVLLVSLLKFTFTIKNSKIWYSYVFLISIFVVLGVLLTMFLYQGFNSNQAKNNEFFRYNKTWIYILMSILVFLFLMVFSIFSILFWLTPQNQKYKDLISISTLVALILVFYIWVWGPIANIRYLVKRYQYDYQDLFAIYDLYLVSRILKSPILWPLYTLIVFYGYRTFKLLNVSSINKW